MKITAIRVLHKTPGLRSVASRVHPYWFFRASRSCVSVTDRFWPHTKKLAQPFRELFRNELPPRELTAKVRDYLLYLRLYKDLECAWANWEEQGVDWINVEGEEHLIKALQNNCGAVLISCHNYGFSKLVAPSLSRRGYRVTRGGGGRETSERVARWGKKFPVEWQYLDYEGDYWHRYRVMRCFCDALKRNEVIHVSPHAYRTGIEELGFDIAGRKYYWDEKWLKSFAVFNAPVLPCFAIARPDGTVSIIIHQPLPKAPREMGMAFTKVLRKYLVEFPQFGRMWRDVFLQRDKW